MLANTNIDVGCLELLQQLAIMKQQTENEVLKALLLEAWEDERDRIEAEKALQEYRENPSTCTLKEFREEMGWSV